MLLAGSLVDLTSNDVPTRVINLTNDFISLKRRTDIGLCGSVLRVRYLKHRNNETTTKTYEKLQETSGICCRNLDASPVSDKNLKINS